MTDLSRYSLVAVVLLVVLRLSIGWQLLYEGLWKIDTLDTPKPWTSAGYLKNATGPMRQTFRDMAGDPDELGWLDYEKVASRWTDWAKRFETHYELSKNQKAALDRLLNGAAVKVGDRMAFAQPLEQLPSDIGKWPVSESVCWYDAKAKKLYVSAEKFMTATERSRLENLVEGRSDAEALAFLDTLNRIDDRQKKGMGYLNKLKGAVRGNPELLGNDDWQRLGKKEQYVQQLKRYEQDYAKASTPAEWDHLSHTWGKIQSLRSELTGPVKAMQDEFYEKADGLLTLDQHSAGEMPQPWTLLRISDTLTILGLTCLGTMLILGLFTRFACVMAAFMLFNFYLAMPPLPGGPPLPGPEHSFIINKNLIEVFALLALASVPSGLWFGLDNLLGRFFVNWKSDGRKLKSKNTVVEVESATGPTVAATT